ncbi:hypothetical protein K502DRAFT_298764 [Neoconidiobolus thromboides FSU 785]|nr:hypothetical protein K502DRAFT_298764 [Neoconidiobolus thromboides FSU 785]
MLLNSTKMVVEIQDSHTIGNSKESCETLSGITSSNLSPEDPNQTTELNKLTSNSKNDFANESNSDHEDDLPSTFNNADPEQKQLLRKALKKFNYIESSVYLGSARNESKEEYMPCLCKLVRNDDGTRSSCDADSNCINRMLMLECKKGVCAGGRHCKNQRFTRKENSPLKLIETEKKGFGLEATADYRQNQFVMEYVGEVISHGSFIRRAEKYHEKGHKHFYFMSLKADRIIDATTTGSLARFINHSCNPNCILQKWMVGSRVRIGIFSKRAIKKGEELTFDYQFERYGAEAQICYCGEPNCKGILGGEKQTELRGFENSDEDEIESKHRGLCSDDEVSKLASLLMRISQEDKNANRALMLIKKMKLTEDKKYLKTFLRLHGLTSLKALLELFKDDDIIFDGLLDVLDMLPIMNKNKLVDLKIFETLETNIETCSPEIKSKANRLLLKWDPLPLKYIIPRLQKVDVSSAVATIQGESDSPSLLLKKFSITDSQLSAQNSPFHVKAALLNADSNGPGTPQDPSELKVCSQTGEHIKGNIRRWEDLLVEPSPSGDSLKNKGLSNQDSNANNVDGSQSSTIALNAQSTSSLKYHLFNTLKSTNILIRSQFVDEEELKTENEQEASSNLNDTPSSKANTTKVNPNFKADQIPLNTSSIVNPSIINYFQPPLQNGAFPVSTPWAYNSYSQGTSTHPAINPALAHSTSIPPYNINYTGQVPHTFIHNHHEAPHQPIAPTTNDLPPGWCQAIAPTGQPYYYHSVTRMTRWDKPKNEENIPHNLNYPMNYNYLSQTSLNMDYYNYYSGNGHAPSSVNTPCSLPTSTPITDLNQTNIYDEKKGSYPLISVKNSEYTTEISIKNQGKEYKASPVKRQATNSCEYLLSSVKSPKEGSLGKLEYKNIGESNKIRKYKYSDLTEIEENEIDNKQYKSMDARDKSVCKFEISEKAYTQDELKSRCKNMIAKVVVHYFNPYYKYFEKEFFKKHAERMTTSLVTKEMRQECYKEGRMRIMNEALKKMVKGFVIDYAKKLVAKKEEYEKSK